MIKIVADTLSGLTVEEAQKLGIAYIPQIIVFGDQTYRDDNEIDSSTFMKKLRESSSLPKTAAPPPVLYNPVYEEFGKNGNTILVVCPSNDLSGTVRSAQVAAKDFPDADIRVIDTRTVGAGLGTLVRMTVKWVNEGCDADLVISRIMEMAKRERVYFYVDTLEYLYKGGRIGAASALVGSIFQIKPILALKDGKIGAFEKQRTKNRALTRLIEMVMDDCPHDANSYLAIQHAEADEDVRMLTNEFKNRLGLKEIPQLFVPPAICVHAGPGVVGVSYFVS